MNIENKNINFYYFSKKHKTWKYKGFLRMEHNIVTKY